MTVTTKPCTAWWTTPDRPCMEAVTPQGQHHCAHVDTYSEHEQQVHPKCECRCGATHKKPVAQLMIDRHEAKQRQVSINCGPGGVGSVVVGGVDIANIVTSVDVTLRGMQPTKVTLGMGHVHVIAEAQGELDEETAKALEVLGWSGPDTELLRRRDLQDALGGLGAVLREWDDLIGWVRRLHEFNVQLTSEHEALAALLDLPSGATRESIEAKVRELQAKAGEQP